MPSYKWDFNSCAFRDGFCKSSHIWDWSDKILQSRPEARNLLGVLFGPHCKVQEQQKSIRMMCALPTFMRPFNKQFIHK